MLSGRIVERYLWAECTKTWLAVVLVLVALTLCIGFAHFINQAASGGVNGATVFIAAAYRATENMKIVLPVSLLLAILLTIGRLCRDNEMAALAAGGIGLAGVYRPFMALALVLCAVAVWLSFFLVPQANTAMAQLREKIGVAAQLQSFQAEQFLTLMDGRAAFYADSKQPKTGIFEHVFIRVRDDKNKETVVLAKTAVQQSDAKTGQQTLVLRNGWRYEGEPGEAGYRVIQFAEHGVHVRPPTNKPDYDLEQVSTQRLWHSQDLASKAELQRRMSVPVSVVLLALLAVPLGYLPPRAGRYGRLIAGVVVYLAYANGLRLAQVWYEQGHTPAWLGIWWVHALVGVMTLALIARHQGWFVPGPARRAT